jgi:hypothetical protein
MKIAVCLSGLIRNFNPDYFSNLDGDVDIFCHTWDYCDVSILKLPTIKDIQVDKDDESFKHTVINVNDWPHRCRSPRQNIFKMYYGMKRCIEMLEDYERKNNFKYDLIVRSRYDIRADTRTSGIHNIPRDSFKLTDVKCKENDIIFPVKGIWVGKSIELKSYRFDKCADDRIIRVNDSYFIGNETSRILCKTYNHFDLLKNHYKSILHNENLIAHMCLHYNFNIILKNFECNLCRDGR